MSVDRPEPQNRLGALNSWPWTAAGIIASLLLLAWMLHGADWRVVATAWRRVPFWCIFLSMGIPIASVPLRVLQWQWLLGRPRSATLGKTLRAFCLGELGNAVLPVRSGELLKTYLLSRSTGLPFAGALTSTVLVRAQDFVPILVLLALMLASTPLEEGLFFAPGTLTDQAITVPGSQLRGALWTLAAGTGVLAIMLAAGYRWRERAGQVTTSGWERISVRFARWWGTVSGQVSQALSVVGKARRFWGAQGLSFLCWGLFVLAPVPVLAALGISSGALIRTAIAVTGLTTIAHVLPAAPTAIGTFHFACMVALLACNPQMDRDTALAAALLLHAADTASTALPGLVVLCVGWRDPRPEGENCEL